MFWRICSGYATETLSAVKVANSPSTLGLTVTRLSVVALVPVDGCCCCCCRCRCRSIVVVVEVEVPALSVRRRCRRCRRNSRRRARSVFALPAAPPLFRERCCCALWRCCEAVAPTVNRIPVAAVVDVAGVVVDVGVTVAAVDVDVDGVDAAAEAESCTSSLPPRGRRDCGGCCCG